MTFRLTIIILYILYAGVSFAENAGNDSLNMQALKSAQKKAFDYWSHGKFEKSMFYYREMLKISEHLGERKYQSMALNNIGFIYSEYDNIEKTLEYYLKALEIRTEENDTIGIGLSYNNIGLIYYKTDSLNNALTCFHESLRILRYIKDSLYISNALNNIGNVYIKMGRYNAALDYHNEALLIRQQIADQRGIAESYKNLSNIYIKTRETEIAEDIIDKGINISKEIDSKKLLKEFYLKLYELNRIKNNFKTALDFYVLYSDIDDSLRSLESQNKISELEIQYQTEKKEQKIKLLKIQDQVKAEKIADQRTIIKLVITALLIFIVMFFIVGNMYLQRRRAYKKLVSMNIEANEKELMVESIIDKQEIKKYKGSNLDENRKQELLNNLVVLMEEEKFYLNPGFSIEDLSKKLDTNRQYLSQLINEQFSKNFNSFINEYRIKEARRLLILDENKKYTIEGISRIVGFNSRTSFISAFKKYTGVTPSFFINNHPNL